MASSVLVGLSNVASQTAFLAPFFTNIALVSQLHVEGELRRARFDYRLNDDIELRHEDLASSFDLSQVKAPRFPKGYPSSIAFEFIMWVILIGGSLSMERWKKPRPLFETRPQEESQSSSDVISVISTGE